jgi:bifunctional DNA-binding transcriptional regulator/antitoxin component of YhaV-PrlF toxin-antitoxin module
MLDNRLKSMFLGAALLLCWFMFASIYSTIKYAYSEKKVVPVYKSSPELDIDQQQIIMPKEYRVDLMSDDGDGVQLEVGSNEVAIMLEKNLAEEFGNKSTQANDAMILKLRELAQTTKELCIELNGESRKCYGTK